MIVILITLGVLVLLFGVGVAAAAVIMVYRDAVEAFHQHETTKRELKDMR
jgi:hypothetical protein